MKKNLRMRWHLGSVQAANTTIEVEGPPLHILLVEDDEDDFIITRDLLAEIRGNLFNLEWVETYEAGLAIMPQNRHDHGSHIRYRRSGPPIK